MKKILLVFIVCLSFLVSACSNSVSKDISCDEIIKVYEDEGYIVEYHIHKEDIIDSDIICNIKIYDPKNSEKNYLYIDRYVDEEKAELAAKDTEYNIVIWFIYSINGENRWLKSKQYGVIHYHSFNKEIMKPLETLME